MSQRLFGPLALLFVGAGLATVLWTFEATSTLAPSQFGIERLTVLIRDQGPAAGAISVLRLATFAASVYISGLMLLTLIARLTGRRTLERLLAGVTPKVLRPVLGVLAISTAFVAQPAYAQSSGDAPVMIRIDDATTTAPDATIPTTTSPVMRWIGPAEAAADPTVTTPDPAVTTPDPGVATANQVAATWTVERGDHLWHITEATLLGRFDRLPTVRETHDYWTILIAANRDRLTNPDNPSLIYPGQEFVLPAP